VIAIDTNVLLRLLLRDDPRQSEAASRLMEEMATAGEPAFISLVTLVEFVWVLEDTYRINRGDLPVIVRKLLNTAHITIEQEDAVRRALESPDGDFSDRIIHFVGAAAGCDRTVTFDRKFARLAGVQLIEAD